jgi:hypothetical protein
MRGARGGGPAEGIAGRRSLPESEPQIGSRSVFIVRTHTGRMPDTIRVRLGWRDGRIDTWPDAVDATADVVQIFGGTAFRVPDVSRRGLHGAGRWTRLRVPVGT